MSCSSCILDRAAVYFVGADVTQGYGVFRIESRFALQDIVENDCYYGNRRER